jgi:hypothetical protein
LIRVDLLWFVGLMGRTRMLGTSRNLSKY